MLITTFFVCVVTLLIIYIVICYTRGWHRSPLDRAEALHHADPPRARAAVRLYEAAVRGNEAGALLPLARLHHYGLPEGPDPVAPNPARAVRFYEHAVLMADVRDRVEAMERLRELHQPPRAHVILVHDEPAPPPKAPKHVPRSDAQNVHDSGVTRTVAVSLSKLPEPHLSMTDALGAARRFCNGDADALGVLDKMETNTTPLVSLGVTESDVLRRVVSRIESAGDETVRDNMARMLVLELKACADGNTCTSGRVARVVDSLSVLDPAVSIKPAWVLRQEMMGVAASMGDDGHDVERLRQKLHDTYVRPGLATAAFVDAEIASWQL
jgi:TPR repeat protein